MRRASKRQPGYGSPKPGSAVPPASKLAQQTHTLGNYGVLAYGGTVTPMVSSLQHSRKPTGARAMTGGPPKERIHSRTLGVSQGSDWPTTKVLNARGNSHFAENGSSCRQFATGLLSHAQGIFCNRHLRIEYTCIAQTQDGRLHLCFSERNTSRLKQEQEGARQGAWSVRDRKSIDTNASANESPKDGFLTKVSCQA